MAPSSIAVSPDGSRVAFSTLDGLETVAIDGANPRRLVEGLTRGVSAWGEDGYIYFVSAERGIHRVSDDGGAEETVVPVEGVHIPIAYRPIPGSDVGVYQRAPTTRYDPAEIWSHDRSTGEKAHVVEGLAPRVLADGRLSFATTDGSLRVAPMDPTTGQLIGATEVVESGIEVRLSTLYGVETAHYAVSGAGTLVYRAGAGAQEQYFAWLDRAGTVTPIDPGFTFDPGDAANRGWRLSPAGDRVAFAARENGNDDIWVKELPSGPTVRLTRSEVQERMPQWSPDGERVLYRTGAELGALELHAIRADGTREAEVVWRGRGDMAMGSWSPDGEWLIMRRGGTIAEGTGGFGARDILALRLDQDSVPRPVAASPEYAEHTPALSRDGRWIAYSSSETGRPEVYVRPFPAAGEGRWAVSTAGGVQPVWAHNGREIFFVNQANEMVSLTFGVEGANFVPGEQRVLFPLPEGYSVSANSNTYDVAPDDQRFLVALREDPPPGVFEGVVVVINGLSRRR